MKLQPNLIILFIYLFLGACNKDSLDNPIAIVLSEIESKSTFTNALEISIKNELNNGCKVYINDSAVSNNRLLVKFPGFYSIIVTCGDNIDTTLFVILNPERGESEWGLGIWTPVKWAPDYLDNYQLSYVKPTYISEGIHLPVVFIAHNGKNIVPVYEKIELQNVIVSEMKRGLGSVFISKDDVKVPVSYKIGKHEGIFNINFFNKDKISLRGAIIKDSLLLPFSEIHITQDLIISNNVTLTISEGCELLIDEGINIFNEGRLLIDGSNQNPVFITCSENDKYWGGIISKTVNNEIRAKNVIVSKSGFHTSQDYQYGHAKRQALFYMENSKFWSDSCYFIEHIGQIFYPVNSSVEIKNSLVQRAKTGGQINQSVLLIENCVFTDFPDDSQLFADNDNDGLYINQSDANIINSAFMHAKDDGIDSGADGGGTVNIVDCVFESIFHEGLALSSGGTNLKTHLIKNCNISNCGQGIELGYSSPNHSVTIDSCFIFKNHLGVRYGDNYTSPVRGKMVIKNSKIINNKNKDIWNMLRETWEPLIENIVFENCTVSIADRHYSNLIIEN